ncbi:hypothetical protein [Methanocaldococcus sp.]
MKLLCENKTYNKIEINIKTTSEYNDTITIFEELEYKNPQLAYTKKNVEEYLNNYKIGYIFDKYPEDLREKVKDKAIDIILTNLKLRNPEHRKNKVKLKDILHEIFVNGLIKLEMKNKKIETAIKLAKGEIDEKEAEKIFIK